MFVIKILALSLLVLVSSVLSEESENVAKSNYKFNHPPQSESYQSIPVAIVYDAPESEGRKSEERIATTYHPRFRALETVTEPSKYTQKSSTNDSDDFPEEEDRRVKRLRKILRKARLRLRTEVFPEDDLESASTLLPNLEDAKVVESPEKTQPFYKKINRRGQRVRAQEQTDAPTTIVAEESTTTKQPKVEQIRSTTVRVSRAQQEDVTVKEVDNTENPPPVRQRGQRVRPLVQTEAPSSVVTTETTQPQVGQPNRKQNRGRGSVRYRNYEQPSTETIQKVSPAKPIVATEVEEDENYPEVVPNLVKSRVTEDGQLVFAPERENYPSSEQPKLTNNRPGPKNQKPHRQNNVLSTVAIEESTDAPRDYTLVEQTNKVQQGNKQRLRYFSQSSANDVEIQTTKEKSGFASKTENNPSTLRPKINRINTQQLPETTTEEENYPRLPIVSLQPKTNVQSITMEPISTTEKENYPELPLVPLKQQLSTNERTTTIQPITVSENENYPKSPIVPHKQQLKTSARPTTVQPITTTEEENYPKLPIIPIKQMTTSERTTNVQEITNTLPTPLAPMTNEKATLTPVTSTKGQTYTKTLQPKIYETFTAPQISTSEEENYPRTVKPLPQHKGEVTNVQFNPTRKQENFPSTGKPQTLYQQTTQEVQNEVTVPRDVDGRVITLKSSFDVATLSPIAKSVLQKSNKPKVIYKVQRAGTPSDIADEPTTLQTTTEEITITTEIIPSTEKPYINENKKKPQLQKTRNHNSNENEVQIPVVIVYDNSDSSVPVNQRKILRTKINPVDNSELLGSKSIEPVKDDRVQEPPKTGNVTENVNAERRTRGRKPVVPIVESENHVYAQSGKFNYRYESGDGTNAYQEGILKPFDNDVTGEAVKGGFSYTDKDGNDFSLSYTADENGYRPIGAHLPTPPPIPPAIARALAHLATKTVPDRDEVTETSLIDQY